MTHQLIAQFGRAPNFGGTTLRMADSVFGLDYLGLVQGTIFSCNWRPEKMTAFTVVRMQTGSAAAKTNSSNCSLFKWAVTAVCLRTAKIRSVVRWMDSAWTYGGHWDSCREVRWSARDPDLSGSVWRWVRRYLYIMQGSGVNISLHVHTCQSGSIGPRVSRYDVCFFCSSPPGVAKFLYLCSY